MARVIGNLMCSHVPAIGGAIAKGLQQEPYWKPFFDAFVPVREWLAEARPDIVVTVYNDHGLNFFLDKMPTFAVGAAPSYRNADEGWGLKPVAPFEGAEDLSWHLVESLVAQAFDLVTCQEMLVDHAFTLPMKLLWPDERWPVRVVPVCVNTVLFPLPSASRCWQLGRAIGRAVQRWDGESRVLVVGSGGLSHQLEGERAGHINRAFDLRFLDSLVHDPTWATQQSINDLVRAVGTQGIELLNWLAARATLGDGAVHELHRTYHIPISNTAAAVQLLAPRGT
ncbi:class III extradiol dioxygenase family protein [Aquabacterium humicola]|uniref:class III extradiol dioxygenase family protein n=1 Tax=Aquabacterium humicola TaxID=3237377 RepID=UPI002543C866|nr:class III extradiol dioxygenase family protein [Rubrivivax pictus]